MDTNAASKSHSQTSKFTNEKRKQLKKTKTLPIIKQTKTSMIRMVNANPLLLLHDKTKEEKSKLTGIQVPKSFDFQKTEEFIKATYGLFQRMVPTKGRTLTNVKSKITNSGSSDGHPQKAKPNRNKNDEKNVKNLKSNKELVKYCNNNNNNTMGNFKNRRNLKRRSQSLETVNNNKQIPKRTKANKDDKSQRRFLPSDNFDSKFMSFSVVTNPCSMSPIPKETNLKAIHRAKKVFFSTPVAPRKQ